MLFFLPASCNCKFSFCFGENVTIRKINLVIFRAPGVKKPRAPPRAPYYTRGCSGITYMILNLDFSMAWQYQVRRWTGWRIAAALLWAIGAVESVWSGDATCWSGMGLEPLTRLAIGHRGSIGIVAVTTNLPDSNSDKVPGLRCLVLSYYGTRSPLQDHTRIS